MEVEKELPFPVVLVWFKPLSDAFLCMNPECQSENIKAVFMMEEWYNIQNEVRSVENLSERITVIEVSDGAAWEAAYAEQKSGKLKQHPNRPICSIHARFIMAMFLNKPYQSIQPLIDKALRLHESIILFDRNLDQEHQYPALVVGWLHSLADFYSKYASEVMRNR